MKFNGVQMETSVVNTQAADPILGTIPLNSGRFAIIVHSGCIFTETAGFLLKKCPGLEAERPDREGSHPAK